MIAFVRGIIEDITEDTVVLDTGSIGYNIKISGQTAASLPGIGKETKLYTYTLVREDAFLLYGFMTRDELEIFKKLITVNGIGPKGGLAILSVMSADDLRFAIISGDAKAIAKAPGIGAKTAGRVILDLKDKISMEDTLLKKEMNEYADAFRGTSDNHAGNEAVEALIALGYSPSDALKAVKKASAPEDADVETVLKLALKNMY
ncbi:MAG: Holliday junction branch migration protein RuvA [Lachnospiraceae bacterium]|nr:Holliday junction branch migration protein RuvA [Lachnospiraceae bacterium]MCI7042711.1 Holliday junction branch migration protein RuvA [Lachnospiraceae bacterium]MCI7190203.1 Holliday junction branch migration protein RuvA [Lachnospiraceae bacterium]MDD7628280.1 Holliday junction branch migration protein RuvA [Lachnospiraceae bacterium]MDY4118269.1 Holliday junction branch migration protein RuvA [Lachnospiraceae bacterium]